MNPNELALWIMGALFTALVGLIMLVLRSILVQGRELQRLSGDTNAKVGELGVSQARLEVSVQRSQESIVANDQKIDRVESSVGALAIEVAKIGGAHDLAKAFVDALKSNVSTDAPRRRRGDA